MRCLQRELLCVVRRARFPGEQLPNSCSHGEAAPRGARCVSRTRRQAAVAGPQKTAGRCSQRHRKAVPRNSWP
ncbi:hypothetical protein MRX96_011684 [Rhipicephalus microplus]